MKTLALLCLAFLLALPVPASAATWEPSRTWVFAVGVIDFADGNIGGWPQARRKDAELMELLLRSGVPASQLVFLRDDMASLASIRASFRELLARTQPGDNLLVYYTGHGSEPTAQFPTQFLTYDYDGGDTSWGVDEIVREVEAGFRGGRVFLLADACYTGSLCEEAAKAPGSRLEYACLTSASSRVLSTGNWTFTEALIEGLSGKGFADADRDGVVSWAELRDLAELDMAVLESQPPASRALNGFDVSLAMARAETAPAMAEIGARVAKREADERGRVQDSREKLLVDFIGDPWVEATWHERLALVPVPLSRGFAPGESVKVEWEGKAESATVLGAGSATYKVRLAGSGLEEWVTEAQVYSPSAATLGFTSFGSFRPKVLRRH